MTVPQVQALLFDVFGTVVDWRSGVAREAAAAAARIGRTVDAEAFAESWRALYQPSMDEVRSGRRPFVPLDVLHRETLDRVLEGSPLEALDEAARRDLARAWHRLDPWPDTLEGMRRLRQRYILAAQSNGNVALIVAMARRAGLPWDVVLGAEVVRAYKPLPESYLGACAMLGLEPSAFLMVAAHITDLEAAVASGLRTAYVHRPLEFGAARTVAIPAGDAFDMVCTGMVDLAARLGC